MTLVQPRQEPAICCAVLLLLLEALRCCRSGHAGNQRSRWVSGPRLQQTPVRVAWEPGEWLVEWHWHWYQLSRCFATHDHV